MSTATVRGRFVWHELLTTDTASAAAFFTKVTGWKTQPWPQDASYTLFVAGGRPMAGLMRLPEEARAMGAPPNWISHIGTPDVDQTVRQAAGLGAKILRPAETVPTVGRFAVLQDPQGAVFAVYKPDQIPPESAVPAVGDFSWHELVTTDWKAALAFYKQLFGWEETSAMDMGPEMGTYQMYGIGGRPLGGMYNKPPQMPAPPHWMPYIKVKDSKRAAAIVKKLGGRIINGPMEVPGGDWIVQGLDLQGAAFAVHSVKPAAQASPAPSKPAAGKAKAAAKPKTKTKPKAKAKPKSKSKPKSKVRSKAKARPARKTAARKRTPARKKGRAKVRTR